ncbi:hypothetical protein NMG60_11031453 [Bertholletia excelsa]
MLLGKRSRPPMRRTTSMTEFTLDLSIPEAAPAPQQPTDPFATAGFSDQSPFANATAAPRNHRRRSADFVETAQFLRACSLCKRRLVPGRDIYMYRGDSAFCSLECRQQQIKQDERKERCSSVASKKGAAAPVVSVAGSKVVAVKGGT